MATKRLSVKLLIARWRTKYIKYTMIYADSQLVNLRSKHHKHPDGENLRIKDPSKHLFFSNPTKGRRCREKRKNHNYIEATKSGKGHQLSLAPYVVLWLNSSR